MSNFAMAVDIGGTFTDVVLRGAHRPHLGRQDPHHAKSLDDRFLHRHRCGPEDRRDRPAAVTDVLVHATTVVTNA